MIKRPKSIAKPRIPALWVVLNVGHFAPAYGREVAVFWDREAAEACSEERNTFNYATSVSVYAYEDECA
ncbi:hypothetical protein [Burkholderia vietnamiensis]|uniref:hypothetical protein n=1 Tax=Burkholderia vietnamiensis TaxID=60552 RepID=UPI001B93069C|nr:hypothetical protein [Burkholderia vietnamiensis]MBR8054185.1 hypothetical protein [Burkholderia vietnamiensis]